MRIKNTFKFVLLSLLMAAATGVSAQQIIQSNLYYVNYYSFNPASAGSDDVFSAFLSHRKQWMGLNGAPVTSALSVHTPVGKHVGFGGNIMVDKTDVLSRVFGSLSYAYHVPLAKNHTLSFGVSAGIMQNKLNVDDVVVPDPSDVVLAPGYYSGTTIFGDFGIRYKWKGLVIGAAAPKLFESSIDFEKLSDEYFEIQRQYIFHGGYDISLLKGKFKITPSGVYRFFPNGVSQFDANLHLKWDDKYWLGGTYRQEAGYIVSGGLKIAEQVSLGYAYEFATEGIGARSTGSHEAILGFTLGGNRKKDEEQDKKIEELANAQKDLIDQIDSLYNLMPSKEQQEANTAKIDSINEQLGVLEDQLADVNDQMLDLANELADQSKRIDAKVDTGSIRELLTRLEVTENTETGQSEVKEVLLERGYYVVIESFRSQDNALKFVDGFNDRSEKAIIVHNKARGWYYCYLKKYDNLKEALVAMRQTRGQGFEDAWVHIYKP